MNRKKRWLKKTKLNKTIPLTGTIEFKLWNQNGWRLNESFYRECKHSATNIIGIKYGMVQESCLV